MSSTTFFAIIAREIAVFLTPLVRLFPAAPDAVIVSEDAELAADRLNWMMVEAGLSHLVGANWHPYSVQIMDNVRGLQKGLATLGPVPVDANQGALEAFLGLLGSGIDLARELGNAFAIPSNPASFLPAPDARPVQPADVARAMLGWLVWQWVEGKGALGPFLELIGALTPPRDDEGPVFYPEALTLFMRDPPAALAASISWGEETLHTDRIFVLVQRLALLAGVQGRIIEIGEGPDVGLALPLLLVLNSDGNGTIEAGLRVEVVNGAPAGRLALAPYGKTALKAEQRLSERTVLTLASQSEADGLPAIMLAPDGTSLRGGAPTSAGLDLKLRHAAPTGEPLSLLPLGRFGGVRAGALAAALEMRFSASPGIKASAKLEDGLIEVNAGDGDGFLSILLKDAAVRVPFDLGVTATRKGIVLNGAAGLEVDLPIVAQRNEVLKVDIVHLRLGLDDGVCALTVAISGSATLGPFTASVERLGLRIEAERRALPPASWRPGLRIEPGRLAVDAGQLEVSVRIKPMDGLGLAVDLGPVSGGGFLSVDPEKGRYAGALALQVASVGLSAFGVILTKMPDGTKGFSMLAFVRGEFAPIQLGFGFTLNAVGGIIGIHRDLDANALFEAVRAGQAGELLAPDNPVRDAPRLIARAEGIFPARRGRHVFGPTMQIGWGVPRTLITMDLALALNLPAPIRVLLIGRVSARLPDPDVAIIVLNLDVAGVLDMGLSTLEIEGRLYDSHINGIGVVGGFALQMAWGRRRAFAFSVGGLHPGFVPPTGFPALPRAGISLAKSADFSLQLLGYVAITSNSLQFGASLELLAKAGRFGLEAFLGFDALIVFDPFQLDARLRASARIFRGRDTLMRLALDARLRGPGPWQVNGKVTFEICWIEVSVSVSKSIGARVERRVIAEDVASRLRDLIKLPANWSADRDGGGLAYSASKTVVVPGRRIVFTQKEVPLGLRLDLFGGLPIAGPRAFELVELRIGWSGAIGVTAA
jgi:hypothetical protein